MTRSAGWRKREATKEQVEDLMVAAENYFVQVADKIPQKVYPKFYKRLRAKLEKLDTATLKLYQWGLEAYAQYLAHILWAVMHDRAGKYTATQQILEPTDDAGDVVKGEGEVQLVDFIFLAKTKAKIQRRAKCV